MAKRRKPKPKPKTGRPPEATRHPERIESLVSLVSGGCSLALACRLTGLARSTVTKWLRDAKKPKASQYISDLSARIKKAQMAFVAAHLANIQRASLTEWTASSWLLERVHPEEFAPPAVQLQLREIDRQLREVQKTIEANRQASAAPGETWQQISPEKKDAMTIRGVMDSASIFVARCKHGEPFKEGSHRLLRDLDSVRDVISRPEYCSSVLQEIQPREGEETGDFLGRIRGAVADLAPWEKAVRCAIESIKLPNDG